MCGGNARRGVLVPQKARGAGVRDRIDHPVDLDLPVVGIALHGDLRPRRRLLHEAHVGADARDLGRQVEHVEDVVEGASHASHLIALEGDRRRQLLVVLDMVRAFGRRRLDRFDPDRVLDAVGEFGTLVGEVEQREARDLVDHVALHQTRPVFVLAGDDRLERGGGESAFSAEHRHHHRDGEVPVAGDGVDRPVERVQQAPRPIEQVGHRDDALLQLVLGAQRVERVALRVGHALQHGISLVSRARREPARQDSP